MTAQVTCSACSTTLNTEIEWAGKRVKCPKCDAPVCVPSDLADEEGDVHFSGVAHWLLFAAVPLISVIAGGVGGYNFGYQSAKTSNAQEVADARSRASNAEQSAKESNAEFAKASAAQVRDATRLAAATRELDAKTMLASQHQGEAVRSAAQVRELSGRITEYETQLTTLRANHDRQQRQLDAAAKLSAERDDAQRRGWLDAEEILRQARNKASEAALVRLKEYVLTSEDSAIVHNAVLALRQSSLKHNAGERSEIIATRAVLRECVNVVRIAGDVIPKDSKYTLSESWNYALGGK